MKFSRERVFHLAARMTDELLGTEGCVALKGADDIRAEIIRVLADETRVEESIDAEVRKILSSYARPAPEVHGFNDPHGPEARGMAILAMLQSSGSQPDR